MPSPSETTLVSLECSSEYCSVALLHRTALFEAEIHAGQTHAAHLLGLVAQLLAGAGISLSDCDVIAFGAGPGSFTGLRVACAVAQGLALGAGIGVVPVSTLTAMAEQACFGEPVHEDGEKVLCVQDARMGEFYWSVIEVGTLGFREGIAPRLDRAVDLLAALPQVCERGCGNGFAVCAELRGAARSLSAVDHPHAASIARLAAAQLMTAAPLAPDAARPLYVRDRVALITIEREQARGALS